MAFRTMYPPQKDSPSTFLLGDISAVDTLITVSSAAVLPQTLPYPLTLGFDKAITETVIVTAQNLSNNQLTITRGTPAYSWTAGTRAARVLTAKDFSDVQDNIADLNTGLSDVQETVAGYTGDIAALQTTVGGPSSGLVKGLADEIVRATTAEEAEVSRATTAEGNLNTIKVNRSELAQVITDWTYSADETKVQLTINRYNASTQQSSQYTKTIPIVTDETMGVMTPEAYAEISALRTDVNALINLGGRFIGVSFATKAALDAYVVPPTVHDGDFTYVLDDETHSDATTQYARNGSVWEFTFTVESTPIGIADTTTAGIVKSQDADGKIFVETDGTMSVVGWDAMSDTLESTQTTANGAIQKGLGTAADQVLVSTGVGAWGARTKAQFKTWLASVAADISDFAATVRGTVLTGMVFTTNAAIAATDTILVAMGKLQAQISTHKSRHATGGDDALTPADIGAETPSGAQTKANTAETNAKNASRSSTWLPTPAEIGAETPSGAATQIAVLKHSAPVTTAGSASALTATLAGFSLTDGATVRIKLHTAIAAGATLNVQSTGAKAILNNKGVAVIAGAIAGAYLTLIYNGTSFILQGEGGDSGGRKSLFGNGVGQISTYELVMMSYNPPRFK